MEVYYTTKVKQTLIKQKHLHNGIEVYCSSNSYKTAQNEEGFFFNYYYYFRCPKYGKHKHKNKEKIKNGRGFTSKYVKYNIIKIYKNLTL